MQLAQRRSFAVLAFLSAVVLVGAPRAQGSVHVVAATGQGDFVDLQNAVHTAASGDLLLLRTGVYGPATIDAKALVVIADLDASVTVGHLTIRNLAASQSVTLHGLRFEQTEDQGELIRLFDNEGVVWIEDCRTALQTFVVSTAPSGASVVVHDSDEVILARCEIVGGSVTGPALHTGDGLFAMNSNLHVFDSRIVGGEGFNFFSTPGAGGPGVQMNGGFLLLSGCEVSGGRGALGGFRGAVPLCSDGGNGGPGLFLAGGTPDVRLHDTEVQGGEPGGFIGTFPGCFEGLAGQPMDIDSGTVSNLPGVAHRFDFDAPLRSGEVGSGTIQGVPGELYWLGFSGQADTFFFADWSSTLVLGQPAFSLFLGVLPETGTTEIQFPLFHSTSDFIAFYDQVVFFDVFTSTIALSSPARKVVLNAAL